MEDHRLIDEAFEFATIEGAGPYNEKDDSPPRLLSADEVARELRGRIQRSELAPGEWLREARLCNEFGVGRSIVRRALGALAEDGLVETEENRGARVSAITVEEVFDLYEIRAALYGMAARFACLRGSDSTITRILADIDRLLSAAGDGASGEAIIAISEAIFGEMSKCASADAQRMIAAVQRKMRFQFAYIALAINSNGPGPYEYWRKVRMALLKRDADLASQAARDIMYFMQGEVARVMLSHGSRFPGDKPLSTSIEKSSSKRRNRRS